VSDRLREVHVVYWASAIAAIGAIIAATAVSPLYAYIGFGILGLGVSVIGPMGLALVGKVVPPHMRTEAISKVAVIGFSGFFLAPVLMGFVSEAFGLRMAFFSVAGLLLVAVPLARMASNLPENGRGS
jgi:MFS family permease